MNRRLEAIKSIRTGTSNVSESTEIKSSILFQSRVFHRKLIEKLPKEAAENWLDVIDGKSKIDLKHVDIIAKELKIWAIQHGATHYTHWFQPLRRNGAEKHDSFLNKELHGEALETFSGRDLYQGEPDASSFPSGGLRLTHEARGYTVWDPTNYPFLMETGGGLTLYIPALFFTFEGSSLDYQIPLLRSEEKLNQAVEKLFTLFHHPVESVYSTLGAEQEYFLIDRSYFLLRPDLFLSGRTLFGRKPAKGQELEEHYFSSMSNRVLSFGLEFEEKALRLGIPLKTRHSEVAIAQYEVAPLFEKASIAASHNLLLMRIMEEVAIKHNLACLFHEKPFKGFNGSGKHNNWSIATSKGKNLLNPDENSLIFLTLLTAILRGVYVGSGLLRASIASFGNDQRLGGSEAPPSILSIYLGEELENIVREILGEKKRRTEILEYRSKNQVFTKV